MQEHTKFQNRYTQNLRHGAIDRSAALELRLDLGHRLRIRVSLAGPLLIIRLMLVQDTLVLMQMPVCVVPTERRARRGRLQVCTGGPVRVRAVDADTELGKLGGAPAESDELDDEHEEDTAEGNGERVGLFNESVNSDKSYRNAREACDSHILAMQG